MQSPNEVICVIDRVEDDQWEDKGQVKKYKVIITKAGEDYKVGERLEGKWGLLKPGVAVRLQMDAYKGQAYVKDLEVCQDLCEARMKELSQPVRNPKDISIEKQTAVKCVSRILGGGQPVPDDIKELTFTWLRNALK